MKKTNLITLICAVLLAPGCGWLKPAPDPEPEPELAAAKSCLDKADVRWQICMGTHTKAQFTKILTLAEGDGIRACTDLLENDRDHCDEED